MASMTIDYIDDAGETVPVRDWRIAQRERIVNRQRAERIAARERKAFRPSDEGLVGTALYDMQLTD
jgi:hypothetical protein